MTTEARTYSLWEKLRGHDELEWEEPDRRFALGADDVPRDAGKARLRREKESHRGIGERQSLRHLIAAAVDQPFLDEISTLEGLERLDLEWPVTASDLGGLRNLKNLVHLGIEGPRNATDFTPVLELPKLRKLFIENAKHLRDVEWLGEAHHLEAIGVEGSIWTKQRIPSLKPFAGLQELRGLFLTSVRLEDKKLTPLADCPRLQVLQCARFAPREEFQRLHQFRPDLECSWFDPAMWGDAGDSGGTEYLNSAFLTSDGRTPTLTHPPAASPRTSEV